MTETERDFLKEGLEDYALSSNTLNDKVSEMLYKTFGEETMDAYYDANLPDEEMERIDRAEAKFTAIILSKLFKELAEEYRDAIEL